MPDWTGDWLPWLLWGIDAAERQVLTLLASFGWVSEVHGQPAWPWAHRVAVDVLAIDRALTRDLLASVGLGVVALLLLVFVVWRWRRLRAWRRGAPQSGVGLAAVLWLAAPWPATALLWSPATPTSFHRSPTGFQVQTIVRGEEVYQRLCADCHGADARGEGPRTASLPMWPPDLNGALLWRRQDGDLLWRVLHGLTDRKGQVTMPGMADHLSAEEAWAVLDYLQANAAGQTLRNTGVWSQPVALPDVAVDCDDGSQRRLRSWTGQRLRIVIGRGDESLIEDPRFVSVLVRPPGSGAMQAQCQVSEPAAAQAFARLAGVAVDQLAGTQFLVDRRGWVRARSEPGRGGWSDSDFLCRSDMPAGRAGPATLASAASTASTASTASAPSTASAVSAAASTLDTLIARMDAEPVRGLKGSVPH